MIDVAAVRAATPGCAHAAHLDNAGSSLPSRETTAAVVEHLALEERIGGYAAAAVAEGDLARVTSSLAALLGSDASEIALAGSESAAFVKAWWGFVLGGGIRAGQTVVVDRINYSSHYLALLQARRVVPFTVEVLPSDDDGGVDPDSLETTIGRGDIAAVVATAVGTHCGLVNPFHEIGESCRRHGVPYFLDACQAVGQLPLDVAAIGCDVLTGTGRKFLRGPRGTGFLYVSGAIAHRFDPPGIDGVSADWVDAGRYDLATGASRFEEFEFSVAARLGLGCAVDQALALGLADIEARVGQLAARLRDALDSIRGCATHDGTGRKSAIVTFSLAGRRPAEVVATAATRGIRINASTAPWARLDMAAKGLEEVVRASPHYFNTDEETEMLAATVADLV